MKPTIEKIAQIVCDYTGVPLEKVRMKTRNQDVVYTRHLICLLARRHTLLSHNEIGAFLYPQKPMNHTTIMSAVIGLKDRMSVKEQPLCMDVERLNKLIRASIEDYEVKQNVKDVASLLEMLPGYEIEPCRTFGDLAEQLHKRLKTAV